MEGLNFYIITHFLTALISLFVAYVVFVRNRKSITHITLALMSLSVFLWASFYSLWLLSDDKIEALFWARALNLSAALIPAFLLHWILCFLKINKEKRKLVFFYYLITAIFVFFSFSDYYIRDVVQIREFFYWPQAGWLYLVFLLISWIPIFIYSFFLLIKELKIRKSIARQQIIYVLMGSAIGFLGGSTNYFLVLGIDFIPPVGSALVVFFPVLYSYAIIRYRFMDIKLVLRQSSVYILSLGVIFGLISIVKVFASRYLSEFIFWMDLMAVFFAVATFPYIKDKFFRLANKYFFTSLYDSGKLILKTGNELKAVLNIEKVYEFLYVTFSKNLHTKAFGVLTYEKDGKGYRLQYNQGFKARKGDVFDQNPVVEENFIKQNKIVITEELRSVYYGSKTKKLIELLEALGVELLIPLKVKGNMIGLLALGAKETEDAYNDEDLQVLEIIAGQAAVAIENAQLYSEAKRFNTRLRREVKKATGEVDKSNKDLHKTNDKLIDAYQKLKQLDSAKNEFISIASHQLRTPLTSIKGFISLIREGDYGKISKEADGALKKIFISNERLIKLVNDLLSLSRIESGKFSFSFEKNDVAQMVKNVVHNLSLEAEDAELKLNYIKPDKKIAPFHFDRDKMYEVISNLVDNAIKYTAEGQVEVQIKESSNKVRVIVADTGKGMRKDESKYVFDKFRRGVGSSSLNTEGIGLGLYVCKKIVNAHKGKILAESEGPGKGSRFIVELKKNFKSIEKA